MLVTHWAKHPPTHRLLAMFLEYGEYGKGEGRAPAAAPRAGAKGFDLGPSTYQAFGKPCRQSQLHPRIRRSVEEFQAIPGYKAWREKLSKLQSERAGGGSGS